MDPTKTQGWPWLHRMDGTAVLHFSRAMMDATSTTALARTPWNKGKIIGQKAPLKPKDIWSIRVRLQMQHRTKELALFNLGFL